MRVNLRSRESMMSCGQLGHSPCALVLHGLHVVRVELAQPVLAEARPGELDGHAVAAAGLNAGRFLRGGGEGHISVLAY